MGIFKQHVKIIMNVTVKDNNKNSRDIFLKGDYWDAFLYIKVQDKFGIIIEVTLDIRYHRLVQYIKNFIHNKNHFTNKSKKLIFLTYYVGIFG